MNSHLEVEYVTLLRRAVSRLIDSGEILSYRACARRLGLDSGTLSRILAGRRPVSLDMAVDLVKDLGFSPEEREIFLRSVISSTFLTQINRAKLRTQEHCRADVVRGAVEDVLRLI